MISLVKNQGNSTREKDKESLFVKVNTPSIETRILDSRPNKSNDLGQEGGRQFHPGNFLLPRLELQFFEGTNPRNWNRNCTKCFDLYKILDAKRVKIVVMYLEGTTNTWFQGVLVNKRVILWNHFMEGLCSRSKEVGYATIIDEFNKLYYVGIVKDY